MEDNKNNVAIILYARFPSEMAYGNHVIQIANSFLQNNCSVSIYYPKTYNQKSIQESPENFYKTDRNIQFNCVKNFDVTSYKVYEIMPLLFQKLVYSLSTMFWSFKLRNSLEEHNIIWSTNPNILLFTKKSRKNLIYEKHGEAKYIQKLSINLLKRLKNITFVALTKKSFDELITKHENTIYLPNGVDTTLFKPKLSKNDHLTVGYIGMLETYGVDKGVLNAVKMINSLLNDGLDFQISIIGGPEKKINEIVTFLRDNNIEESFMVSNYIDHKLVPNYMQNFDIGIVPYPKDKHIELYSSPLKIFELAACGIPILASNLKSHVELGELGLGMQIYDLENPDDFIIKLNELLLNEDLRNSLREKSLNNINKLDWTSRTKTILSSVRSSTG